ncbi:glycosyltransferase [Patescibacteria group bacterium]|nr:glycosyltransferase [Patescibacteria group bacterium]MBU1472744.1 glycosyltransferase [Patescibacteria group bacterium]MBU2460011.1 glycosyltransferase [Patescibacteria group bacterium]MBU2544331.1 glycosyltransferase [Patescibacteria group bacterium]
MSETKKLSLNVVIPVYNEEVELEDSVKTLMKFLEGYLTDFRWKITIADNASTDRTFTIAKRLMRTYRCVEAVHLIKKGRGRAVKHVWGKSRHDIVAYMDVDLSTDLKHFPALVRSLLRGYDIAIGTRNLRGSRVYGRSLLRTLTSKAYIFLVKLFFWVHFSDAQCGFKAVTGKAVKKLLPQVKDNAWFFDTELLLLAEKLGYRIYEEPVTWTDNPGSTVRVLKTAMGDLEGLWRLFTTRPWRA